MLNKTLFQRPVIKPADTTNKAGGLAYSLPYRTQLAFFAATGCFNDTFYTNAETQLAEVLKICQNVDSKFIAKVAVFAAEKSFMRDMPAFLLAYLSTVDLDSFEKIFNRIITNGDMLKRFCQIIRSGAVGRKSFGTRPKRLIQQWLINRPVNNLIWDSVGNDPSLGDVIRMSHPNAGTDQARQATFAYLLGAEHNVEHLPANIKQLELFKKKQSLGVPNVPINLLTSCDLSESQWKEIAKNCSWTTLRNSLNTFQRHGVFSDAKLVTQLAAKLVNKELIRDSKTFPYKLLTTYIAVSKDTSFPRELTNAIQQAMELSTENVPTLSGQIDVFIDVSGSMRDPITGTRLGATTSCRCVDVAAMIAACVLRKNANARVTAFDGKVHETNLNPFDSIVTNATKLAAFGGGSTYCPGPMKVLNQKKIKTDFVIYISDNESWINGTGGYQRTRRDKGTELATEWRNYRKYVNPNAKMVCLDLVPGQTTQALDDKSIMNIAGFSDNVFTSIASFLQGGNEHWTDEIDKIKL